jgi:hypothetical protein
MSIARVQEKEVPGSLLGPLRDSTDQREDSTELQQRVQEDGYVFIRQGVPRELVQAVRDETFAALSSVDEVSYSNGDAIATGRSRRKELHPDLGAWWKSVSEGRALRRATHGPELRDLLTRILGVEAVPHDYLFLRCGTHGKATDLHYDMPFFSRGSQRVHTVWISFGDLTLNQGPLMVLEGSNCFEDLLEPVRRIDYASKASPRVGALDDAITMAQKRGTRLLTSDYQMGDAVIFGMNLMHGAFDHDDPENRVRLSCDIRFQPAADERDPRYFGPNPGGTTGMGYGELNGAKPLTEPWHQR